MKLICDQIAYNNVLSTLKISCNKLRSIKLSGFTCIHNTNHTFFFTKTAEQNLGDFLVLDLSGEAIWTLDKFQSDLSYKKQCVNIEENTLIAVPDSEYYIYIERDNPFMLSEYHTLQNHQRYIDKKSQLNNCDVYLLIPGKLNKEIDSWDKIPEKNIDVFDVFHQMISHHIAENYNSNFLKNLSRKCIGEIVIEINDLTDGNNYYQDALIGIVKHDTGICALEIMIQNCAIGGNKILNYYCGNLFQIIYEGSRYSLQDFMKKLNIRQYGKKRSMIFSYGDVTDEEIINALANEEFPMGKIHGLFKNKVEHENIAQYDTAEVYVSEETMFEKCADFNIFGNQRIAYNAAEIFFVELILFQDAAIDKIYNDLATERERQKKQSNTKDATTKCEEISFDMALAIQFANYEQFNFPTVRQSAKNVARCFGIDHVYEKYEMNKTLLESLIQANKRRTQEKQDNIKNHFLFILSAVTTIGMLGDIFYVLYQDRIGGVLSYTIAFIAITFVYGVYKSAMFLLRLSNKKKEK